MDENKIKLFLKLHDEITDLASKIDGGYNDGCFEDIAIDLEPHEWNRLQKSWKKRLVKLGINISNADEEFRLLVHKERLANVDPPQWLKEVASMPWRKIPGYVSIMNPISESGRSRGYQALDIPDEVAMKILTLGMP